MKKFFDKLKEILKKNWIWVVFLMALIGFLAIAKDIFNQEIIKMDTMAYKVVVENLRSNILTPIMQVVTNLGGIAMLVAIAFLSLVVVKRKKIGLGICGNLALISALNLILKNVVQRPRPEGYRLITESGYSFPSGHSMINTAFYGFIIYLIFTNVENKYVKYTMCTLLTILIPLIAVSRVYLGVHYASDVLAGFLLSIAYLVGYIKIYQYIKIGEKNKKEDI